LIDALIAQCQEITMTGDVAVFPRTVTDQQPYAVISTLVTVDLEGGKQYKELKTIRISPTGDAHVMSDEWVMNRLEKRSSELPTESSRNKFSWDKIHQSYEGAIGAILSQIKTSLEKPVGARVRLLGVSVVE
jgi:hypothetical protein